MAKTKDQSVITFIAFNVVRFESIRGNPPRIQIQNIEDNKLYEVTFAVSQHKDTGELQLDVVRHFVDPTSQAWFPDSDPWED